MDNIALIGMGLLTAVLLVAGLYLEGQQRSSRAVPVIRAVYRNERRRPRW